MIRKWLITAIAMTLLLAVTPAWAAPTDAEKEHHKGHMTRKDFQTYRLDRLKEMATYFGIPTEGKTVDELKKEVTAAKEADKEKWEAFKAEHQAKKLEHLRKLATEHGIKTEGKTADQLREELFKLHGGEHKQQRKGGPEFPIKKQDQQSKKSNPI